VALLVHHVHDRQWFAEFPRPVAAVGWLLERWVVPRLVVEALRAVREIEAGYSEAVGPERYESLIATMQAVLDAQLAAGG
jgi:HD-like signal output (HDOD) protein